MNEQPMEYRFRVRYGECDPQNVVFNARYADYVDMAANEFIRAAFGHYQHMLDAGLDMQVVSLSLNWSAPARFDDVLCARIGVTRIGNTSLTMGIDFVRFGDEQTIARAEVVYVMIDPAKGGKKMIPDALRETLLGAGRGVVVSHAGE